MQDVCLFAHFDKDDKVDDYVLWYLAKLKELNYSIVFISAARLSPAHVERLYANCHDVILRENVGLDFGSWAAGFRKYGAAIEGRLLLANDSVYGPIGSLRDALDRLTHMPADFYGMVESIQIVPHLQSWFLLFEPWIVRHETFKQILAQPFHGAAKKQIIEQGEIALSRRLTDAGFHHEALYKSDRPGLNTPRHAMHPMLLFWREILFDHGIPFLKIELLRDNTLGLEDAGAVLQSIEGIEPALCGIIKSHLARTRSLDAVRRTRRPLPARFRYALIRKRYRLWRENRRAAAAWTTVLLEILTAPLVVWRTFKMLLGLRRTRV